MYSKIFEVLGVDAKGLVLPRKDSRLFSDCTDQSFDPEKMKAVVEEAERLVNEPIPLLTLSLYMEFMRTGNRSRFEAPHHTRRRTVFVLALAEYYEGKGRFIEKIADYVWAITEESTWVLPAHLHRVSDEFKPEVVSVTDLYSGNCSAILSLIYYMLKDKLDQISPLICERIKLTVRKRGIDSFLARDYGWFVSERPNNWLTNITANILTATAILEDDEEIRQRVVDKAIWGLDRFIQGCPDDGGCDEGPGYWAGAAASLFDCLEIISDMTGGRVSVFHSEKLRLLGEFEVKMHIHQRKYVNFSDCHPAFPVDGYFVQRFGKRCNSRMLEEFGKYIMNIDDEGKIDFRCSYRTLRSLMMRKDPSVTDIDHPTSTWMAGHQVAVFRESPKGAEGLFIAAKGGCNGEAHNHLDVGSFIVYYCGEPVLIDPGCGIYTQQYFSKERYTHWNLQSGYHNLPSFGGVDQHPGKESRAKDALCDTEKKTLSLDLTDAYPPEAELEAYRRGYSLEGGVIHITEEVRLRKESEIRYHFMTRDEPTLTGEGEVTLPLGRRLRFDGAVFTPVIEKVDKDRGISYKHEWGRDCIYRIILSTVADRVSTEFTIE